MSDQLTDLAGRTERLEDAAAAAQARNRAVFERDRDHLFDDESRHPNAVLRLGVERLVAIRYGSDR